MSIPPEIKILQEEVRKELPGLQVQLEMAPATSISFKKPYETRKAGVLILLFPKNGIYYLVFIQRPNYNGVHSGQISFPGGQFEEADDDLIRTALRESYEEIGICTEDVKVLGTLSHLYIPVSNFEVKPVVGYLSYSPNFKADPVEVNQIIELPLYEFTDTQNKDEIDMHIRGEIFRVPCFYPGSYQIWGATAMILSELIHVIRKAGLIDLLRQE